MAKLRHVINKALRPFGVECVRAGGDSIKPWDSIFQEWISDARSSGRDPNDRGDEVWGDPSANLERYYYPHLDASKIVLELGPGTGRYTRHLINRCSKLILVDYSEDVVRWLREYMKGKGNVEILYVRDCSLSPVADSSIDVIFANGVFEHLYLEDFYRYLRSFHRVLRQGGVVVANFDNFMSPEGYGWFKKGLPDSGRNIFRFYHSDMVQQMCTDVGFTDVEISKDTSRFSFFQCRRADS